MIVFPYDKRLFKKRGKNKNYNIEKVKIGEKYFAIQRSFPLVSA